MRQSDLDAEHARLVAQSRRNAARYTEEADLARDAGDAAEAEQLEYYARMCREEADRQEAAGAHRLHPRRPGVRTAADKARACGEPTVAQVRAGRR